MIHEPDVALTDFALCVENGAFAWMLFQGRRSPHAALLFSLLSASSLVGGAYHGFFPAGIATGGGWAMWITTMLLIGAAAAVMWLITAGIAGIRTVRPYPEAAALALFAIYAFIVVRIDSTFRISAFFSAPPLLALPGVLIRSALRDHSRAAQQGVVAILLMLTAAVLQQAKVGISPDYFNHNALYHLIQGIALALLFRMFRGSENPDARVTGGTPLTLEPLEAAALKMLLEGNHPVLVALRAQLGEAAVNAREMTGVGFFTTFSHGAGVQRAATPSEKVVFGDVEATISGLKHGAGFLVFVKDGLLDCLEGFSYDEPWPERVRDFSLRYSDPTRAKTLAELG